MATIIKKSVMKEQTHYCSKYSTFNFLYNSVNIIKLMDLYISIQWNLIIVFWDKNAMLYNLFENMIRLVSYRFN